MPRALRLEAHPGHDQIVEHRQDNRAEEKANQPVGDRAANDADQDDERGGRQAAAHQRQQIPGTPTVAVLPLSNIGGDPALQYFADGATETLISDLARSPEIRVIARTSSDAYRGKALDVRQIGKELNELPGNRACRRSGGTCAHDPLRKSRLRHAGRLNPMATYRGLLADARVAAMGMSRQSPRMYCRVASKTASSIRCSARGVCASRSIASRTPPARPALIKPQETGISQESARVRDSSVDEASPSKQTAALVRVTETEHGRPLRKGKVRCDRRYF